MRKWPEKQLGDFVSLEYGKALRSEERSENGRYPVYGSNGIVGSYNEAIVKHPTIIVGRKGAIGETHLALDGCWPIDTAFYTVLRQQDIILLPFLLQWFRWVDLKSLAITSTIPGLNRNTLYAQKLPLPPLPEQERIVKLLDEADELRKLREQADKRSAELIPALFEEIFGDPGRNPKKWEIVELVEMVSKNRHAIKRGPFGGAIKKEIFVPEGYKVFEQKNAIRNDFNIGNYFIDTAKYKELECFSVLPEDIIISCSGTIGKVAIVPKQAKPGIINQALLKISLDNFKVLPIFFQCLLETNHVQWLLFGGAAGSAIKNVKPLDQIKKTKLPLPPLPLQKEFAARVSDLRALESAQSASRKNLDALFQSLLHWAFAGER
jgi:type I restriction enzyme S subunit